MRLCRYAAEVRYRAITGYFFMPRCRYAALLLKVLCHAAMRYLPMLCRHYLFAATAVTTIACCR